MKPTTSWVTRKGESYTMLTDSELIRIQTTLKLKPKKTEHHQRMSNESLAGMKTTSIHKNTNNAKNRLTIISTVVNGINFVQGISTTLVLKLSIMRISQITCRVKSFIKTWKRRINKNHSNKWRFSTIWKGILSMCKR